MESIELILSFFGEFLDRLSLYSFFPKKKRSEKMDKFLRYVGYVPTFVAFAVIVTGGFIIMYSQSTPYKTASFIATAVSVVYLLAVMIIHFARGE